VSREKELIEKDLTEQIIGAAMEVHRGLGPGLLESAYAACLGRELELRGIAFEREKPMPVQFNVPVLKDGIQRRVL